MAEEEEEQQQEEKEQQEKEEEERQQEKEGEKEEEEEQEEEEEGIDFFYTSPNPFTDFYALGIFLWQYMEESWKAKVNADLHNRMELNLSRTSSSQETKWHHHYLMLRHLSTDLL